MGIEAVVAYFNVLSNIFWLDWMNLLTFRYLNKCADWYSNPAFPKYEATELTTTKTTTATTTTAAAATTTTTASESAISPSETNAKELVITFHATDVSERIFVWKFPQFALLSFW